MGVAEKIKHKVEFGDFQTPIGLAKDICFLLYQKGVKPNSVIEPTCGTGNFLLSALDQFKTIRKAVGLDINEEYVKKIKAPIQAKSYASDTQIIQGNFFEIDWNIILKGLSDPLLVIGNPPWVTSSELGMLGSANLPIKSNFQKHKGFDAITGKSNFDISEWMLIKIMEWLNGRKGTMAVLCKTAVARKVLIHAKKNGISIEGSDIYQINANKYFNASVDACLFVCTTHPLKYNYDCFVHKSASDETIKSVIGFRGNHLIVDVSTYDRWKHLDGIGPLKWRSGIKHDCSKIMEFIKKENRYINGLGEEVHLEDDYLYPMLKSSELTNGSYLSPVRWMFVTQKNVGEGTNPIKEKAPRTWEYLQRHAQFLDKRASSIYRNNPRFSIFGVGDYSFAPWKVAISGFYKKIDFKVLGPFKGKPIVLDDTSYFMACQTQDEANFIASLLNSNIAKEFFMSLIFWDVKRPITAEILNRLNLFYLARELDLEEVLIKYLTANKYYKLSLYALM